MSAYNDAPGLRWSILKILDRGSPLALKYAMEHERADTAAFRFGRAFHAALLEPDRYCSRIMVPAEHLAPSGSLSSSKKAAMWYEQIASADDEAIVVTESEHQRLCDMREAVDRHDEAGEWVQHIEQTEVELFWNETVYVGTTPVTVRCKAKIDAWAPRLSLLIDAKTMATRPDRPFGQWSIGNEVARRSYYGQLAWYERGMRACGMVGDDAEIERGYLFVESVAPHDVAAAVLDQDYRDEGDAVASDCLRTYAECVLHDRWPGACPGRTTLRPPAYMHADETDDGDDLEGLEDQS